MAEISPWMKATSLMVIINATSDEKWLTHLVLEMEYSGRISHYQGPRWLGSVHHQAWCRLCWTLSSMRKDFSYLCQHNVVKWWETKLFYASSKIFSTRVKSVIFVPCSTNIYLLSTSCVILLCILPSCIYCHSLNVIHFHIDVLSMKLVALIRLSLCFVCIYLFVYIYIYIMSIGTKTHRFFFTWMLLNVMLQFVEAEGWSLYQLLCCSPFVWGCLSGCPYSCVWRVLGFFGQHWPLATFGHGGAGALLGRFRVVGRQRNFTKWVWGRWNDAQRLN